MNQIAIIGGGAAGLTAAYFALISGAEVVLFEKNSQPGRKICITGKGRCNITNQTGARTFLSNVVQGSKFLTSAVFRFSPEDTMEWFSALGLKMKTERGNRVFPKSERASEVRDVLVKSLKSFPGFLMRIEEVHEISKLDNTFQIISSSGTYQFRAVIIATGGKSYPLTGSTGDGYKFARKLGHSIISPQASLVRLLCNDPCCQQAQGLALKNVRLSLFKVGDSKPLFSDQGEMLFTEDGISGPLVLSASCHMRDAACNYRLEIDFKPALTSEELDKRILRDFTDINNKYFKNSLDELLPSAMRAVFVKRANIDPEKRVHQITKAERENLVQLFKKFELSNVLKAPLEEAIVTAGGVDLLQVNPRSMESKICPNLYFAGEVLDVDAYTGGFNLQIAFSTGRAAGESAALN